MPKINRIRITNFSYNNNHRHIIDEIFNFYNGENALLSLANGGGKSVLVQAILQPIVPKAKLIGRPISDFFIGKKDPVYIMIEWILDDEAGFLLTGIGISPAMNYNPNEEEDNLNLRFYTFCHQYKEANKYDIKNLEVTQVKNNGIIVVGYNDVKKSLQSEVSKGRYDISCFNSTKDEQSRYEHELNKYSISRNEWKELMVSINQAEHGVSEVFSKCRSSRQVMEQWVIKYIEKVLDKSTEEKISDHQKLEEMMAQVATAEVENESFIQEYGEIDKFKDELKKMDEESKAICGLLDNENNKKKELISIYQFFSKRMLKMAKDEEQMEKDIEVSRIGIEHIKLEKTSYEIHKLDDEISRLSMELEHIEEKLYEMNSFIEKTQYELKLQQGAREYEVIEEKMQEKAELQQLLENATRNKDEILKDMNRIKYSLKCFYSKQIEFVKKEINKNNEDFKEASTKKEKIFDQINSISKKVNQLNSSKGRLEAKRDAFISYESKLFKDLDILLLRNPLLGELDQEEINSVINGYKIKLKTLESEYKANQINIDRHKKEIKIEKERLLDISQKIIEEHENQVNNKNIIDQYENKKARIQEIIFKYCNDRFLVFDKEPLIKHLDSKYEEWSHKVTTSDMEINELLKMINGINEGISYLPVSLAKIMKEKNIEIYTGESYLRELSIANRKKIIANNPLLPYGIIVTDKESEIISELLEGVELSQLVPIFNHNNKEDFIEEKRVQLLSNPSLLKYDQNGLDIYIGKIEKKIETLKIEKKEAIQVAGDYRDSLNRVNEFKWTVDDEKSIYQKRDEISMRLDKILSEETMCYELINQLYDEIKNYEDKNFEIIEDKKKYKEHSDLFKKYLEQNKDYFHNIQELQRTSTEIDELDKVILKLNLERERVNGNIELCKNNMAMRELSLKNLKKEQSQYKNAVADEFINGSEKELKGRLNAYEKNFSDEIKVKAQNLKNIQKDIDRANENIVRNGLHISDVRDVVYSEIREKELQKIIDKQIDFTRETDEKINELKTEIASRNGEKKSKNEMLKGKSILIKSEIKGDFENRKEKLDTNIKTLENEIDKLIYQKETLMKLNIRIEGKIEGIFTLPYNQNLEIIIDEDIEAKVKSLIEQFTSSMEKTSTSISTFDKNCKGLKNIYADTVSNTVGEAVKGIYAQIDKLSRSYDDFYYLTEHISIYDELLNNTMKLMQTKIDQLKHSKKDLIEHAYLEAKNVYDEIPKVVDNSSIEIDKVKKKILDIQYDKIQSDEMAKDRVKEHIIRCLENITKEIKNNEEESKIRRNIIKVMSTKELLNVISNLENFKVKAYKMDINKKNRHMMYWEDLIVKNSGGEKFVAYFSLLVALISYSRKNIHTVEQFKKKEESKVLIMDNPFGPITSGHLLKPMFDIARKYDTQLICFSDIKEGAVINSFNLVYNIKIRQNMMRQEYLDIEENNFAGLKIDEKLEKAYLYTKATQMSLLDE